jgi:hypothetical protein
MSLLSGLMGPVCVVVPLVLGKDVAGVCSVEGKHVVADLVAEYVDHAFAVCVYSRCSRCGGEDVGAVGAEHLVEGVGVFAVAVAEQEAQRVRAAAEIASEVSRLLRRPRLCWVGRNPVYRCPSSVDRGCWCTSGLYR